MTNASAYRLRLQRATWRFARWLRHTLGLAAPREVIRERNGIRWALDPSDYQQAGFLWLWEQWDTYHVLRLVQPDSVVFDVGANFGYYALTIARAAGSGCTVHAFEPNPTTFDRLQRNLRLNDLTNVSAHRLALSDREGTAGLRVVNPINSGSTQLTEGNLVPVTTLDRFCSAHQVRRLDLIKIDVEGFEEKLLQGGATALQTLQPALMIELNPSVLHMTNSSVDRVLGALSGLGYSLFQADGKELVPLEPSKIPADSFVNAFCFARRPKSSADPASTTPPWLAGRRGTGSW